MWLYLNGSIVEQEKASISPFDRGFLFSDGVYEVIRYYPGHGYFQKHAHFRRLVYGLEQLRIVAIDTSEIDHVIEELLQKNGQAEAQAIAYIQVTRGATIPRQHFFPPPGTRPTILITTTRFQPHTQEIENGVQVLLEDDIRWLRCDIKSVALIPSVLARQRAVEAGATETLWSREGYMTEGTHTNFCAVKDGVLLTPPRSRFILSGITRQVVLDLCRNLGIEAHENEIRRQDLPSLSECMMIGTTTEITPIVKIGDMIVGDGTPGRITRKLQREFHRMIGLSGAHEEMK